MLQELLVLFVELLWALACTALHSCNAKLHVVSCMTFFAHGLQKEIAAHSTSQRKAFFRSVNWFVFLIFECC